MIARLALPLVLVGCDATLSFEEQFDGGIDVAAADAAAEVASCATTGCPFESLHCDTTTGRCEECVSDGDCAGGFFERCEPSTHKCVQCLGEGDCYPGDTCVESVHRCLRSCTTGSMCMTGESCDTSRSLCIRCSNSSQCFDPRRRFCHPETGRCEGCVTNADCPSFDPICDPVTLRCVDCLESSDCTSGRLCEPSRHICVTPI